MNTRGDKENNSGINIYCDPCFTYDWTSAPLQGLLSMTDPGLQTSETVICWWNHVFPSLSLSHVK